MKFFKLKPNSKLPACHWTDETNYFTDTTNINLEKYNIALPTGKVNNVVVLDIDVKDNGLLEWNNYLKTHAEPLTIAVRTPNGGYHYYFKLKGKQDSDNFLISNYLTTKTKYRSSGLDIRSNGGYVVYPPSEVNNKAYEFVRGFDEYEILDMPTELIYYLLDGVKLDKCNKLKQSDPNIQPNTFTPKLIYKITDNEIKHLLQKLDNSFISNYSKWLIITTILKGLNKFDIWNSWSKQSDKYDENNNIYIWNKNNGNININYLIHLVNDNSNDKIELIPFYKPYDPLTKPIEFEQVNFNKNYVSECFTYENLLDNDTVIIKSCTGTGKTTAIVEHLLNYLSSNYSKEFKLISLVSKISLSDQHIKSFNDANIKMISYEDDDKNLQKDHIAICVNSLLMYQKYEPDFFNDKILFLDEINSFIESLTHNETLDRNIKMIYQILVKMIKNCHKLILCDALISDNVLNFMNIKTKSKTIFLNNSYKKYDGVNAINLNDENDFLNELLLHCEHSKYFLFGSDSCDKVTKFYTKCVSEASEMDKHKYLLITADSKYKIKDASVEFKNKFVFYSPSITYGVDFSIATKQDVFIYCCGKSLLPSGIFQQTTRTRQINNLYYYCNDKYKEPKYNALEEIDKYYENIDNMNNSLNSICITIDEGDNERIIKNSFYKMFSYNEYVKDIYKTNVKIHFENILKDNGFILSSIGTTKQISKEDNEKMEEAVVEIQEELFDKFLNGTTKEKQKVKYETFNTRIKLLNIPDKKDDIEIFKYEIMYDEILQNHFNLIKLFKSDEENERKLLELKLNSYDVKTNKSIYNKIKLIRYVEQKYKIGFMDVSFKENEEWVRFDDKLYELIKEIFGTKKPIPDNWKSLKMLYIMMLKNVTNVKFIKTTRVKTRDAKTRDTYTYSIDMDIMKYHSDLLNYRAQNPSDYHKDALKILKINEIDYFSIEFE